MPRLPNIKPKQLIKVLGKSGFILKRITGSHHIFYKAGFQPISIPFHNKDMKPGTLSEILKQSKISVKDLVALL